MSAGLGASSLPVTRATDAGHGSVTVSAAVGAFSCRWRCLLIRLGGGRRWVQLNPVQDRVRAEADQEGRQRRAKREFASASQLPN